MRIHRKPVPNILEHIAKQNHTTSHLSMEAFVSAYEALIALLHLLPEAVNPKKPKLEGKNTM